MTETPTSRIQYVGKPGITQDCLEAVIRFVQFGDRVTHSRILTAHNVHALLLSIVGADLVAVKSGFSSGYGGEGPTGFSFVLQILNAHGSEIDEYDVDHAVIERLDASALKAADLRTLKNAYPVRPTRWYDYVYKVHQEQLRNGTLWRDFPKVIPFAIIDPRLIDLAMRFWDSPDACLITAFRRLEDAVRDRTGINQHGGKLFSEAFLGSTARLQWPDIDAGEQAGRANLFTGTYGAFRNPRAHRVLPHDRDAMLHEFLAVNHLFRLERQAKEVAKSV